MRQAVRFATLFLLLPLLGCRSGTMPAPAQQTPFAPPLHGQVACQECRVLYFDGNKVREAIRSADRYTIPAAHLPLVLFVAGPRQVPQMAWVRDVAPAPIQLARSDDPRLGYLAGVVLKVQAGGKERSRRVLEPVADAEVVIALGRGRQVASTDKEGRFQMVLPANSYEVLVEGQRWEVTVPAGDAAFLPAVTSTTLVD